MGFEPWCCEDGLTEEVEGVSAEVLFVGPLDAAEESFDLTEISRVFEFGEDAFFEVGGDIENANFFVVKCQLESIFFKRLNVENVGRFCLGGHDWSLAGDREGFFSQECEDNFF